MFSVARARVFVVALVFLPTAAGAQTIVKPFDERVPFDARLLTLQLQQNQPPRQQRRRDSLWNGLLVGAGLGAMLGAVGGLAMSDCSECSGFNVPLTFGVLGAGVGAGIGAGIDALRQQHSTIASPSHRPRRVRVAPLLAKDAQGVIGRIRF